jgi:hypothetical protein
LWSEYVFQVVNVQLNNIGVTFAQAATLPALNSQERRIAEAGYRLWLSTVVESVTSFSFPARNRFF